MLGSSMRLRDKPGRNDSCAYFASIQRNDQTVASAFFAANKPMHATSMSPAMIDLLIDDMQRRNLSPDDLSADEQTAREFAARWSKASNVDFIEDYPLRIYQLQKIIVPRPVTGELRLADRADAKQAADWAEAFDSEVDFGDAQGIRDMVLIALEERRLYLWDDGGAVSMLLRNQPTPNAERVSVVYTPPDKRGKGYGAAANAALAQIILDSGKRYACLFAEVGNPVSNKMYLSIGYQAVCDVHRYKLVAK